MIVLQKRNLELDSQSWKTFFQHWKEAFMKDDLFLFQSDKEDKLTVTVWCSQQEKKQFPFTLELT